MALGRGEGELGEEWVPTSPSPMLLCLLVLRIPHLEKFGGEKIKGVTVSSKVLKILF